MLPDKNELNDELIEQISGGKDYEEKIGQKVEATQSKDGVFFYTCPNCKMSYVAAKRRTDDYCPNCEPRPLKTEISVGNMKTTIPIPLDKNKLIKVH